MLINVFFDEELTDADIIDIPQYVFEDIENIRKSFFRWLFDKSINHKYWINVDGDKKYCSYRSEAFVEWLNSYYLAGTKEKAMCINMFEKNIDFKRPKINF